MRIIIPYNEILPTRKAHDHFIFREAVELARQNQEVDLLIGSGSFPNDQLFSYYGTSGGVRIHRLPILRRNTLLRWSWNAVFFFFLRHWIATHPMDAILLSVRKIAHALLKKKKPGVQYMYEAHELAWYPGHAITPFVHMEKELFERLDQLIVTTEAMQDILMHPPYSLSIPIHVLPLAVDGKPLPTPPIEGPISLLYVGQLYPEQGVGDVISLMAEFPALHLHILGGSTKEIEDLNPHAKNVHFHGWVSPAQLHEVAQRCHACIAPFHLTGRMPYVAHTKLYLYRSWGRPILAPFHPIVQEHMPSIHSYQTQDELRVLLAQVGTLPQPTPIPSSWVERVEKLSSFIQAGRA